MQRTPMVVDKAFNNCFACSPSNENGLHLEFFRIGEHEVECHYTAPPHLCGSDTVVHGGIQATLLDETMGFAIRTVVGYGETIVTAELALRYRRPTPVGEPIIIRAEVVEIDEPNMRVEGAILQQRGDEVVELTTATARWRRLT